MGGRCQRCGSPGSPSGIPPSCAACQDPARLPGPGALVAVASWLAAGRSQPCGDPGAILRGYRHASRLTQQQLTDLLAGASFTLDDDVLDRIDQIVPPGVTLNPADAGWQPSVLADPASRRRPQAARSAG